MSHEASHSFQRVRNEWTGVSMEVKACEGKNVDNWYMYAPKNIFGLFFRKNELNFTPFHERLFLFTLHFNFKSAASNDSIHAFYAHQTHFYIRNFDVTYIYLTTHLVNNLFSWMCLNSLLPHSFIFQVFRFVSIRFDPMRYWWHWCYEAV